MSVRHKEGWFPWPSTDPDVISEGESVYIIEGEEVIATSEQEAWIIKRTLDACL